MNGAVPQFQLPDTQGSHVPRSSDGGEIPPEDFMLQMVVNGHGDMVIGGQVQAIRGAHLTQS